MVPSGSGALLASALDLGLAAHIGVAVLTQITRFSTSPKPVPEADVVHVALDVRHDPSLSKPSIRHLTMRSPHLLEVLLSAVVADTAFIFASPVDLLYPLMD
jgi:hypothetical protein